MKLIKCIAIAIILWIIVVTVLFAIGLFLLMLIY